MLIIIIFSSSSFSSSLSLSLSLSPPPFSISIIINLSLTHFSLFFFCFPPTGAARWAVRGGGTWATGPACTRARTTRPPTPFLWDAMSLVEEGKMQHKSKRHQPVGVPSSFQMSSSWSSVAEPGNSGRPEIISAKMQPTPQMSICVEYSTEPSSTSGGRYHNVTTL